MPIDKNFSQVLVQARLMTKRGHGNCVSQLERLDQSIKSIESDLAKTQHNLKYAVTHKVRGKLKAKITRLEELLSRQYLNRQEQFIRFRAITSQETDDRSVVVRVSHQSRRGIAVSSKKVPRNKKMLGTGEPD